MAMDRTRCCDSLLDLLERMLDKGIVIDAWNRVSSVGFVMIEARVVVPVERTATPPDDASRLPTFGSAASSRSALTDDTE
jgi:hypothetical protein